MCTNALGVCRMQVLCSRLGVGPGTAFLTSSEVLLVWGPHFEEGGGHCRLLCTVFADGRFGCRLNLYDMCTVVITNSNPH